MKPNNNSSSNLLGFLNLNKPSGWTSHDCVAKVRRLLKIKQVGHGGTLDPAATGVLPIAVGKATRLLAYLPEDKAYRARIRLGVQTSTDDLEGEVLQSHPVPDLTLAQIQPFLAQFQGVIQQIPPAYSAIQRGGKRLYELARKGEIVDVPVRTVRVDNLKILAWYPGEFPELEVAIACGSGTYIRAIARDLGTQLTVGGTLAALTRTQSCGFDITDSVTLETLEKQGQERILSLISPEIALKHLPVINLPNSEATRWCQGQKISLSEEGKQILTASDIVRVHQENGNFLGIGANILVEVESYLIPKIVIANAV